MVVIVNQISRERGKTMQASASVDRARVDLTKVMKMAQGAVQEVIKRNNEMNGENPRHQGGHFCLRWFEDPAEMSPFLIARFGEFATRERIEETYLFAQEKPRRIVSLGSPLSSWQTRDESKDQYGGAIRAGHWIPGFSGIPEDRDETAMLVLALTMGWINDQRAIEIAQVSNNQFFLSQEWPSANAAGVFRYRG